MADRRSMGGLGRNLLLGVAVGTLPLAGCVELDRSPIVNASTISATKAERANFEVALKARNAEQATEFICEHPDSELTVPLLTALPSSEVRRISSSTINKVDPDILLKLPSRVKQQIGISALAPELSTPSGGDGYSG